MKTTEANNAKRPTIKVRRLAQRDLPYILKWARQAQPWRGWEFLASVRSNEILGCVAEDRGRFVGFVLCTPVRPMEATPPGRFAAICGFLRGLLGTQLPRPVCVNLLDVRVGEEWSGGPAGTALLDQLDRDLRRMGSPIRIVVPETHLAVQLFLRGAGYVALRVLHDYFSGEDGYLMEGHRRVPAEDKVSGNAAEACARAPVESA
jgi:ribosomal protein S18 acetylase RimI-like enzyme